MFPCASSSNYLDLAMVMRHSPNPLDGGIQGRGGQRQVRGLGHPEAAHIVAVQHREQRPRSQGYVLTVGVTADSVLHGTSP